MVPKSISSCRVMKRFPLSTKRLTRWVFTPYVHRDAVQPETAQTGMDLSRPRGRHERPAGRRSGNIEHTVGTALFGNPDSLLSLATEIPNLDIPSHGRLSLGLSQHGWPDEGVSEGRRPRIGVRLKETITLLNRLWSEDEVSFKGSHHHLERPPSMSGRPKKRVSRSLSPGLPAWRLTWPLPWPMAGSTLLEVIQTVRREVAITSDRAPPDRAGRTRIPWSWARSSIFP